MGDVEMCTSQTHASFKCEFRRSVGWNMAYIGCQTITWGPDRLSNDYLGVLKEASDAGCSGVESNVRILHKYRDLLPEYLTETKLTIVAGHTNVVDLQQADNRDLASLWDLLAMLQSRYLLVSTPKQSTRMDFGEYARVLNTLGKEALEYGIQVCLHNHNWELSNGCEFLQILVGNSRPEFVGLAADLGWVMRSQTGVEEFVRRFQDRVRYVHLKDVSGEEWTELGSGQLPLREVLPIIQSLHLPWWIVEQDTTRKTALDSVRESIAYLCTLIG